MNTKIPIAGLMLFLASACSKSFLELTPQTSVSEANFFSTEDDYAKAVTGAYSSTAKNNLKGQAEFLRAFYYFDLVQYFGGVPLHLKEVATVAETALPRSSAADVYKQIIADATDAATLLPATQAIKGQATRGAAKMLLGYVYMTLKQYPDAEKVLKDLTGLGYSLLPNYADVFDPDNKNSAESIFEVQYLQGTQGLQNNFAYQFAPGVTDTETMFTTSRRINSSFPSRRTSCWSISCWFRIRGIEQVEYRGCIGLFCIILPHRGTGRDGKVPSDQ